MSTVKNAVWAASASAITALGLLAGPPLAQAEPDCTQFGYNGGIVIKEDSGWSVVIPFTGQAAGGTVTAVDARGQSKQGNVSGSVSGRNINVTATYNGGGSQRYVGDIGNDGIGRGITQNPVASANGIGWHTEFAFNCLAKPAPAVVPPREETKPVPDPVDAVPAPMATISGDVDVYDSPGGGGNVTGTLNEGQQVDLVACNADNWCEIKGVGWVWGDFVDRP